MPSLDRMGLAFDVVSNAVLGQSVMFLEVYWMLYAPIILHGYILCEVSWEDSSLWLELKQHRLSLLKRWKLGWVSGGGGGGEPG